MLLALFLCPSIRDSHRIQNSTCEGDIEHSVLSGKKIFGFCQTSKGSKTGNEFAIPELANLVV